MSEYKPVTSEVIEALKTAVGSEYVLTEPEKLDAYKTDEETNPHYFHLPEAVVSPGSAEEVADVVKLANQYKFPITVRSAGTSLAGGAIPVCGGIVLLLERLNKILEVNHDAMYMVVEAGALTKEIQEMETSNYLSKYWNTKNKKEILNNFDEVMVKVKKRNVPDWDKI